MNGWIDEGVPVLHYSPFFAFDRARACAWAQERGVRPDERMTPEQGREPLLLTLRALAADRMTAAQARKIVRGLKTSIIAMSWIGREGGQHLTPDPLWADEWQSQRDEERARNAAQYDLDEPTRNCYGIPQDVLNKRVFEIRDLCRRIGVSPFDVIRWTRDGMPAVGDSYSVRWDVERVAEWIAEHGALPERAWSPKELDSLEDFVVRTVADGDATPEDAREIFAGWVGLM